MSGRRPGLRRSEPFHNPLPPPRNVYGRAQVQRQNSAWRGKGDELNQTKSEVRSRAGATGWTLLRWGAERPRRVPISLFESWLGLGPALGCPERRREQSVRARLGGSRELTVWMGTSQASPSVQDPVRTPLLSSLPALPQQESGARPLSLRDLPLLHPLPSFAHISLPRFGILSIFQVLQHRLFRKASPYALRVNRSRSPFPWVGVWPTLQCQKSQNTVSQLRVTYEETTDPRSASEWEADRQRAIGRKGDRLSTVSPPAFHFKGWFCV